MSTGLDAFDRAVQRANEWLKDLASELGKDDDRGYAYRVLRTYLHVLRDRLTPEQAVDFASQLPMLLRGVFYEGWKPAKAPETYRDAETFLTRLADGAQLAGPTEASLAAESTTRMLRRRMSPEQVDEVLHAAPESIRRVLQPQPPPVMATPSEVDRAATTVSPEDLPAELQSRVMAAMANPEIRVIQRHRRAEEPARQDEYEVYGLAGDRFVHMRLRLRPDGSVDEITETLLLHEIGAVEVATDRAAIRDRGERSIPVPVEVAVAVAKVVGSRGCP